MKWYFPYGKDLEKEAVNNARIETFRDDIVASLAREISQNSIDEVVDSQKPVHIKFELLSIDIDKIPDLVSYENLYVPYTRDTWKGDKDAAQFLNNFSQVIEKKEISVLKISDFNTTGLENKKWDSLVLNTGTSHKEKGDSQGSFGIGKAAPFAASALRMVFYESMSRNA